MGQSLPHPTGWCWQQMAEPSGLATPGWYLAQGPVQMRRWEGRQNLQLHNPQVLEGNQNATLLFFSGSNNLPSYSPLSALKKWALSWFEWNFSVRSHHLAKFSFHHPGLLSSMGPAWCCLFQKWKWLLTLAMGHRERLMKSWVEKHFGNSKAQCLGNVDL